MSGMKTLDPQSRHAVAVTVLVFLALSGFYFVTAPKTSWTADPLTNMASAWKIGSYQTPWMPEYEAFLNTRPIAIINVVAGVEGPVSQYPPGAALTAAPVYALAGKDPAAIRASAFENSSLIVPPVWPGALVASVTTAGAVAMVFRLLVILYPWRGALMAAMVMALGTGAWSVSSQALWQHGPAMCWIAAGMLMTALGRIRTGTLAWALAPITRPHTILIGAAISVYQFLRSRDAGFLWPLLGCIIGAGLLAAYNLYVFGDFGIFGGYEQSPVGLDNPVRPPLLLNAIGVLFDGRRGLFVYSPYLLILLPGLPRAWKRAPSWVRGAALGGCLYLAVQYSLNRFGGGSGFIGYRYPLEALIAFAPLLLLSYVNWVQGIRVRQVLFWCGVVAAVAFQAVGVLRPHSF